MLSVELDTHISLNSVSIGRVLDTAQEAMLAKCYFYLISLEVKMRILASQKVKLNLSLNRKSFSVEKKEVLYLGRESLDRS